MQKKILFIVGSSLMLLLWQMTKITPAFSQEPLSFGDSIVSQSVCHGIAWHETKLCTIGVGKSKKNCVGIKRRGEYVRYNTVIESMDACVSLWSRKYGGLPDIEKAKRWSGNDRAADWLYNVTQYMNRSFVN